MDRQQDDFLVEEERQSRRDQMRFAARMSDFVGVMIGLFVVLLAPAIVLIALNV